MKEVAYNKEHGDKDFSSLIEELKEFFEYRKGSAVKEDRRRSNDRHRKQDHNHKYVNMYGYDSSNKDSFDKRSALETVDGMYHIKGDKKYIGEKFDMNKANEVHSRLEHEHDCTPYDIYVAINAQYHDYCEIFHDWFGDNIDDKVIDSAIDFWFDDDDYEGNKVWDYFNEM